MIEHLKSTYYLEIIDSLGPIGSFTIKEILFKSVITEIFHYKLTDRETDKIPSTLVFRRYNIYRLELTVR